MKYSDLTSYYNQTELNDDLKKYLGLPPYDTFTNPVVYDGHYLNSLYGKYRKENVTEALKGTYFPISFLISSGLHQKTFSKKSQKLFKNLLTNL